MTGRELLANVRENLGHLGPFRAGAMLDALDGCVLLTADEAEKVRFVAGAANTSSRVSILFKREALALLRPGGQE